ncbi:MAG: nucleotidyltransferase family protein [Lachnospiraceae bacterium]
MNRQTENFLNLIRAFLWNTEVNVADPDWNALFHMANIHNLIPAIYDAVYKLPCFSQAPSHIQKKFQESALYQSSVQFMRTQEFFTLNDEFQANDLHPRVLKGLICRSLYPQPDLRISCDEDLWIRKDCRA